MSERDYSSIPLSEEELEILKTNYKYIVRGNIPPKKEYFDDETFRMRYAYCHNRIDVLKKEIKSIYKPYGTYTTLKAQLYFNTKKTSFWKEFLWDRLKKKSITDLFSDCYDKIWYVLNVNAKNYLSKYEEYIGTDFEYELLAFMLTITGVGIGGRANITVLQEKIADFVETEYGWYHLNEKLFDERCNLYSYIFENNLPRAEWLLGNISENPLLNAFIAFGDILYNPECAKDYFNAPALVDDIFNMTNHLRMLKPVQTIILKYIKRLRTV